MSTSRCLDLDLYTYSQLFRAPFVGLDNFRDILVNADNPVRPGLWNATRNTALYTFYTLSATLVLAMGIALLLNREFPGRRLLRTLMLAPWVVPSFVVAILWQFMWQSDDGDRQQGPRRLLAASSTTGPCGCWARTRSGRS